MTAINPAFVTPANHTYYCTTQMQAIHMLNNLKHWWTRRVCAFIISSSLASVKLMISVHWLWLICYCHPPHVCNGSGIEIRQLMSLWGCHSKPPSSANSWICCESPFDIPSLSRLLIQGRRKHFASGQAGVNLEIWRGSLPLYPILWCAYTFMKCAYLSGEGVCELSGYCTEIASGGFQDTFFSCPL